MTQKRLGAMAGVGRSRYVTQFVRGCTRECFSVASVGQRRISSKLIVPDNVAVAPSSRRLSSLPFFSPSLEAFSLVHKSYSSHSSGSNIQIIKTEEEFDRHHKKLEDDGLPAIFYFTAAWCSPCKFIAPIVEELSKKYSHVATYKVDIDEEDLAIKLRDLKISAVPTFHFFQNGKKVSEVVGADAARLKDTAHKLYTQ